MIATGKYFRIFFDIPSSETTTEMISKALEDIPGVHNLEISFAFKTAHFCTLRVNSRQIKDLLTGKGLSIISIQRGM